MGVLLLFFARKAVIPQRAGAPLKAMSKNHRIFTFLFAFIPSLVLSIPLILLR